MSLFDRYLDWNNLCVNKILFNVVYSKNNILLTVKLVIFLCSVISQGKVVALDRWGGKWNHLSMTHRLTTNYAKNYCNRTVIVKVIVENVLSHVFFETRCMSVIRRVQKRGWHRLVACRYFGRLIHWNASWANVHLYPCQAVSQPQVRRSLLVRKQCSQSVSVYRRLVIFGSGILLYIMCDCQLLTYLCLNISHAGQRNESNLNFVLTLIYLRSSLYTECLS